MAPPWRALSVTAHFVLIDNHSQAEPPAYKSHCFHSPFENDLQIISVKFISYLIERVRFIHWMDMQFSIWEELARDYWSSSWPLKLNTPYWFGKVHALPSSSKHHFLARQDNYSGYFRSLPVDSDQNGATVRMGVKEREGLLSQWCWGTDVKGTKQLPGINWRVEERYCQE